MNLRCASSCLVCAGIVVIADALKQTIAGSAAALIVAGDLHLNFFINRGSIVRGGQGASLLAQLSEGELVTLGNCREIVVQPVSMKAVHVFSPFISPMLIVDLPL